MEIHAKTRFYFKRYAVFIGIFIAFTSCSIRSKNLGDKNSIAADQIFPEGAQPKLISKQFSFTEGPASDKKGNVFFYRSAQQQNLEI